MSTLPAQTHLTPEEYLTWERKQPFKNEYHKRADHRDVWSKSFA